MAIKSNLVRVTREFANGGAKSEIIKQASQQFVCGL